MAIIFYHEGLLMVQRGSPSDFPILRSQGGGYITPPIPTIDGSEVALRRVKKPCPKPEPKEDGSMHVCLEYKFAFIFYFVVKLE